MFAFNFLTILTVAYPAVEINLGQLEQVFTGLFQAGFIIGVMLLIFGIFCIFFPGLRIFVGKLLGM